MSEMSVYFCKIVYKPQTTIYQRGYEQDIREVLNPDRTISRYGRTWRISKPIEYKENYYVGKLGFMSLASEKKTYYDEKQKDFIEQAINSKQGHYVHWVIDLSTHLIAFDTKPPDIRYYSFIGAFKDLLDLYPDYNLTVEKILESSKFYEWAKTVDRITEFTANLRAPNPNFESRPKIIIDLLKDTNADFAKIRISKEKGSGESLNTENTIKDLVKYGEDGYSTIVARGMLKTGKSKEYDSKREVPTDRVDIPSDATKEKVWDYIIETLKRFENERQ